ILGAARPPHPAAGVSVSGGRVLLADLARRAVACGRDRRAGLVLAVREQLAGAGAARPGPRRPRPLLVARDRGAVLSSVAAGGVLGFARATADALPDLARGQRRRPRDRRRASRQR